MSYTSVDTVAKSTRERCIRVAAIVDTIRLGTWNNFDVDTNKKPRPPMTNYQETYAV